MFSAHSQLVRRLPLLFTNEETEAGVPPLTPTSVQSGALSSRACFSAAPQGLCGESRWLPDLPQGITRPLCPSCLKSRGLPSALLSPSGPLPMCKFERKDRPRLCPTPALDSPLLLAEEKGRGGREASIKHCSWGPQTGTLRLVVWVGPHSVPSAYPGDWSKLISPRP